MKNTFNKINKNESHQNLLRTHCISVRLNHEELQILNVKRGEKSKGEWLRLASLDKLPTVVPSINIEAWKSLSEISQKLNILISHLENKSDGSTLTKTEIFAVKRQISELRSCLTSSNASVR
ncbi:hypothetical protein AH860_25110 [Salmonella enterica subsp. enterica serovar Pomona]|uniref:hypothetical protein n=1 Tax=Enterobacterales TaxID=91347 RepID=UPI000589B8C4|nr:MULTISPECIES: hypothetical protein [Enterobacterales]EBZ1621204.1 hypothetical protein [Salmonella enterica subsp. enterica serovar Pomona]KIG57521.1 hypothetical protein PU42_18300 [Escherichia coli]UCQ23899.1 hypothetical protein DCE91_14260 [Edwardsiella piscicida]